jgi:hypothetical protein
MSKSTLYAGLLLLVFWTMVIGLADWFVLGATARQFLARDYVPTRGKIVTSEVRQLAILHAGITLQYSYNVAGRHYIGYCYRYDEQQTDVDGADIRRKFPQGSFQTVYYDPKKPADSVLSTGVEGADLMLMLFATPINVALIMLWRWLLARAREKWRMPEAGGVQIRRRLGTIRVRLGEVSAIAAGLYALGVAAFAATFPVAVINGLAPGREPMAVVWLAVLTTAVVAWGWQAWRNRSGRFDLLIDSAAQTLILPQTCGRQGSVTVPQREIAGVGLQRRVTRLISGSYHSYLPAIHRRDGSSNLRREPLTAWGWTEEQANGFSQWLCSQMGLKFTGIEDENAEGGST